MAKTATKERQQKSLKSVRQKLSAAVVMLLISAILMVTTTYAWFTLSTAPEVTGITTNVGANGNLEIVLLDDATFKSTAVDLGISSKIGDSMSVQDTTKANKTWGNLIDLSDTSYGLDNIILNPARLNATVGGEAATVPGGSLLKAPSYGTDGRVIDVTQDTSQGAYAAAVKTFTYADGAHGVTAIGVSSGITQRLNAYRTANSAVTTNINSAQNAARKSLQDNGQDLANILVGHLQDEAATFTKAQVESLQSLVNALKASNDHAGKAIMQAVLAYNLSTAHTEEMTDEDVAKLLNDFDGKTPADLNSMTGIMQPDGTDAAVTQWSTNDAKIGDASSKLDALLTSGKDSYTWDEISEVVDGLIDKSKATIAGVENAGRNNLSDIANYFVANGKVDIVMKDGSGIYADLAILVGNYTASGFTVHIKYDGSGLSIDTNVPVSMGTEVAAGAIIGAISLGEAPSATAGGGTVTLSELYGYAIDFGFRTNAAASNLLLQTTPENRVYRGETDAPVLQGEGSYMQFSTNNPDTFSTEDVRALMSAMRVAFIAPVGNDYELLAIAALDITAETNEATGETTYVGGQVNGDAVKAELYLYDYEINDKGVMTLGDKITDSAVLTDLQQNVAKRVTAVVYVDGDLVDNTMVANAATSMNGKLNLQFSSDATLKPMENSSIKSTEVVYTEIAAAKAEYVYGGITFTVKDGYTIYKGSDGKLYYANGGDKVELTPANYQAALEVKQATPNP